MPRSMQWVTTAKRSEVQIFLVGLRYIPQKISMVTDSVADPTGGSVAAQKFIFLVTDLKLIRLRATNKLSLVRLLS